MSLYGRTDSNTNKTKAERNIAASSQAKQIIFVDNTEAALSENKQRGIDAPGWWSYFTYTDTEGNTRHKAELLVTIANPDSNANETQADDTVAADVASAITISVQPANTTAYTPSGCITNYTAGTTTTIVGEANEVYTLTGLSGSAAGTGAAFTVTRGSNGAVSSVAITAVGSGFNPNETITILGSLIGGVDVTDNLVITVTGIGTAEAGFSVTASATTGSLVYQWQRRTSSTAKWTNISGATNSSLAFTGLTAASDGYQYRVKITSTAGAEEVISNAATLTVDTNIFA
jgi:hypothetical protein